MSGRTLLIVILLFQAPAVHANSGSDPLHFPSGIPKQSDLLRQFSTLKRFVRSIPYSIRACWATMRSKAKSIETIRGDHAIREKMRELFDKRLNSPTSENCLAFTNVPREFDKMMVTDLGVCAGVTYVAWIANYLAVWDEVGKDFARFGIPEKYAEGWDASRLAGSLDRWRRSSGKNYNPKDKDAIATFYAPFIQKLFVDRDVTVIPHFANIDEFSRHPAIKDLMKRMAIENWKETNLTALSAIEMGLSGRSFANSLTKGEILDFTKRTEEYLESGIAPISFFSLPKNKRGPRRIHVTRVKKVVRSKDGDSFAVIMVDPNFLPPDNIKTVRISGLNEVESSGKPRVFYSRYLDQAVDLYSGAVIHDLAELEIVPWFEFEAIRMLGAWKRFLATLE